MALTDLLSQFTQTVNRAKVQVTDLFGGNKFISPVPEPKKPTFIDDYFKGFEYGKQKLKPYVAEVFKGKQKTDEFVNKIPVARAGKTLIETAGKAPLKAGQYVAETGRQLELMMRNPSYKKMINSPQSMTPRDWENVKNIESSKYLRLDQLDKGMVPYIRKEMSARQNILYGGIGAIGETAAQFIAPAFPGRALSGMGVMGAFNVGVPRISKALGFDSGDNRPADVQFAEGAGKSLKYTTINKLSDTLLSDPLLKFADKLGYLDKAHWLARANIKGLTYGLSNIVEDILFTPIIEGREPTPFELIISGGFGYTMGSIPDYYKGATGNLRNIISQRKPELDSKQLQQATDEFLIKEFDDFYRDARGRFKKPTGVDIRKKSAQELKTKYGELIQVADRKWIRERLGMPKDGYKVEDIPMGMSVKEVGTPDIIKVFRKEGWTKPKYKGGSMGPGKYYSLDESFLGGKADIIKDLDVNNRVWTINDQTELDNATREAIKAGFNGEDLSSYAKSIGKDVVVNKVVGEVVDTTQIDLADLVKNRQGEILAKQKDFVPSVKDGVEEYAPGRFRKAEPQPTVSSGRLGDVSSDLVQEARKYKSAEEFVKAQQFKKIATENPMTDSYHTGIRNVYDIKTFKETLGDSESFVNPDFTREMAEKALRDGEITIYSSKPLDKSISQFVTPSKMMASDYAGNGKVYSKKVNINDIAWINGDEGNFVGKSQLIDIWNQANKGVDTTKPLTNQQLLQTRKTGLPVQQKSSSLDDIIPQTNKSSESGFFDIFNQSSKNEIPTPKDPVVEQLNKSLIEAKPIRKAQEAIYTQERGSRLGQAIGAGQNVGGEKGYYAQLSKLKGEMTKVEYESLRRNFTQENVDHLFEMIRYTDQLSEWEKISAQGGLVKMFQEEGGRVPTKGEIKLLEKVYGTELTKNLLDKRSMLTKFADIATDILNLPRSIMTTVDLSYGLRQGVVLLPTHPKTWGKAFVEQLKYFVDEDAYKASMDEIRSRPTYDVMLENKLALTDLAGNREEAFMSGIAERVPVLGIFTRASGRAYTGFANKLRADVFDDFVKNGEAIGITDDDYLKSAANFINHATGRGSLGKLEGAAKALNGVFFSPRLMASRLNLLNPKFYVDLNPAVRKEALKSMIAFASTGMTVLGLAYLAGAEVGTDPRSADFGKIKIGNTRMDIWGGFQQYIRAASQLISGKYISSTTGKEITLGEGYKAPTRFDILLRQIESKEAPVASFFSDMLKGQDFEGNDFETKKAILDRMKPMVVQDLYELYQEEGVNGILKGVPAIFGVGVQTYGGPKPELKSFLEGKTDARSLLDLKSFDLNGSLMYKELRKLPEEEVSRLLGEISKLSNDPNLSTKQKEKLKDIITNVKTEALYQQKEITPEERGLVGNSVERRVEVIEKKLKKLDTEKERVDLLKRYKDLKILTPMVEEELMLKLKQ